MIFPCNKCQELYDGWTTYQAPYRRWIQGTADQTAESYSAAARERYALIKQQCDLIVDSCRKRGCLEVGKCHGELTDGMLCPGCGTYNPGGDDGR